MNSPSRLIVVIALALLPATGWGQAASKAPAPLTAGEITKVDREARKVTIRHGPIENLKMPPMTMVFRVKDASVLDGLAAGAKVRFRAEEADGGYVVTRLQAVKP